LFHLANKRRRYEKSENEAAKDEAMIWFEIVSIKETLEEVMQNYKDASMEFAKEGITKDGDGTAEEWSRNMKDNLYESINCSKKICYLNQIQELSLFDQLCRLNLQHKDMENWILILLRMSRSKKT